MVKRIVGERVKRLRCGHHRGQRFHIDLREPRAHAHQSRPGQPRAQVAANEDVLQMVAHLRRVDVGESRLSSSDAGIDGLYPTPPRGDRHLTGRRYTSSMNLASMRAGVGGCPATRVGPWLANCGTQH